jgi:hypothetical protein
MEGPLWDCSFRFNPLTNMAVICNSYWSISKTAFPLNTSIAASHQISAHFGKALSEKKIFLEIDQSKTRISCGSHVC